LSEASDEGFLEELIDGQLEFFAQITSRLADVPSMDIDCYHTPHRREPHGIEGTGDRFLPMETPTTVSGINRTEGTSPLVFHKYAVLASDNLSHQFTILIRIHHPFCFDLLLGFWREVIMHHFVGLLKEPHFFHRDRGTCITFYATGSVTLLQVTAEEHLEEVEGNEGVEDFKHGGLRVEGLGFRVAGATLYKQLRR
jgi:hypothetical protein